MSTVDEVRALLELPPLGCSDRVEIPRELEGAYDEAVKKRGTPR